MARAMRARGLSSPPIRSRRDPQTVARCPPCDVSGSPAPGGASRRGRCRVEPGTLWCRPGGVPARPEPGSRLRPGGLSSWGARRLGRESRLCTGAPGEGSRCRSRRPGCPRHGGPGSDVGRSVPAGPRSVGQPDFAVSRPPRRADRQGQDAGVERRAGGGGLTLHRGVAPGSHECRRARRPCPAGVLAGAERGRDCRIRARAVVSSRRHHGPHRPRAGLPGLGASAGRDRRGRQRRRHVSNQPGRDSDATGDRPSRAGSGGRFAGMERRQRPEHDVVATGRRRGPGVEPGEGIRFGGDVRGKLDAGYLGLPGHRRGGHDVPEGAMAADGGRRRPGALA